MIEEQHICKNCIMINGFLDVYINPSTGLCSYCEDPAYKTINWWKTQITEEQRQEALKDWNMVAKEMQYRHGEQKYDCILGYSGGKDSTALLYLLINEYNLNPLAITINNGFIPDTAFENIQDTLSKIDVDHVIINRAQETFTKLYKWLFLNRNEDKICLTRDLCDNCGDLVHSICVKEAMKRNIDIIVFGYSPDEIRRYFYEIPQHEIKHDWIPEFIQDGNFNDDDRGHYLGPNEFENRTVPRILLPYHAIDYQEEKIIELIESKGLIKKGNSSTIKTSCFVVAAALFHDLNRYGGLPYTLQFAELIRQDPSIRKKWLITMKQLTPIIREAKFNEVGVQNFFDKIGTTKESILDKIRQEVENDPNREHIIRNINMFQPKRKK